MLQPFIVRAFLEKTLEYLGNRVSLEEFEDWLLPNLTDILTWGDEHETELAKLIEGSVIEIGEGITTEDELRAEIRKFLTTRRPSVPSAWHGSETQATEEIPLVSRLTENRDFHLTSSAGANR